MFDKSSLIYNDISNNFPLSEQDIISSGDYYFYNFLSSKVKLTDIGLYILDTLKTEHVKTSVPRPKQPVISSTDSTEAAALEAIEKSGTGIPIIWS